MNPKTSYRCENGRMWSALTKAVFPLLDSDAKSGCFACVSSCRAVGYLYELHAVAHQCLSLQLCSIWVWYSTAVCGCWVCSYRFRAAINRTLGVRSVTTHPSSQDLLQYLPKPEMPSFVSAPSCSRPRTPRDTVLPTPPSLQSHRFRIGAEWRC